MKTVLIIYFLAVQSSYAQNSEAPATDISFDTVQFFSSEGVSWRIKTYATDQDIHAWSLGEQIADLRSLARTNTERHYGDLIASSFVVESTTGIEGLKAELKKLGLSSHLEISKAGFVFWAPEGSVYKTRTRPAT